MKYCLKHISPLLLAIMMTVALVLPVYAQAVSIDLLPYAKARLTEVLGYTVEEASEFVFGEQEEDTVEFWHPDHPEWKYSVYIDRKTSQITGTSPFDTGYLQSPGEAAVQSFLRSIRSRNIFTKWNRKAYENLLSALKEKDIRISTSLYFAEDAGTAVYGLFESCFGPEFGWTEAVHQLLQDMMDEYHLAWEPIPFHLKGIRRNTSGMTIFPFFEAVLFEGEIPEELKPVLDIPQLAGWECTSGALLINLLPPEYIDYPSTSETGLAAFEKNGRRQLVQFGKIGEEWRVCPLGENALYRSGDYRVTYDGLHNAFAVDCQLSENELTSFFLMPYMSAEGEAECIILAYEHLDYISGEAVWINVYGGGDPTWKLNSRQSAARARFPYHLGLVPVEQFPASVEEADRKNYPGVPDQYTLVYGANFRSGISSHSHSYGELKPGVIIPILEILPGDPNNWIHTRLGTIEGYVVANYTASDDLIPGLSSLPTVAESKKEFTLKRGTGWFDGSVGTWPAGTQMHVIFDSGDWLYVDIPSGEMNWVMDPEGTFGFVHKNDVTEMPASSLIRWPE